MQRRETGRPEIVYGPPCRLQDLHHNVELGELEVITRWRIETQGIQIGKADPDGLATVDGRLCAIELDYSGHMTLKQMIAKWLRYPTNFDGNILVIAMKEHRMYKLMEGAEVIQNVALFTTFDRLRNAKEPWMDRTGDTAGLAPGEADDKTDNPE